MKLSFMLLTMVVGVFFNDLTALFQLTGSMYGLILQLILPVAFYVKAYNKNLFKSVEWLRNEEDIEELSSLLHPREERVEISKKLGEREDVASEGDTEMKRRFVTYLGLLLVVLGVIANYYYLVEIIKVEGIRQ